ncbi:phage tail assembly chaperone [Novosphingobium sp. TH158]|uniref:phage tail assembly chaperone n=1 Tax=Novosphingobium sp. TH158 TaxID=2067455 RepID=UPI0020B151A6|nr:phage tail assembly chaperone [Novosphingobium sp. TH158]
MSEGRFGTSALRFCSLAARMLGWHPAEFWDATPAELAAILAPQGADGGLSRNDLTRMMEQDNG